MAIKTLPAHITRRASTLSATSSGETVGTTTARNPGIVTVRYIQTPNMKAAAITHVLQYVDT